MIKLYLDMNINAILISYDLPRIRPVSKRTAEVDYQLQRISGIQLVQAAVFAPRTSKAARGMHLEMDNWFMLQREMHTVYEVTGIANSYFMFNHPQCMFSRVQR